ncbi:MAG: serine protease [Deltaproteobacteria bacterium]|nr:MAG: serine protease [Deltaproteobacteria bacterium]
MKTYLIFFIFPFIAHAGVLGTDNRLNLNELESRSPIRLAKATATQINLKYLDSNGEYPTGRLQNLCPGERYSTTPTLGGCSGFLIAPDILATAGHCFDYKNGCENDGWLFNHFHAPEYPKQKLNKDDVYRCSSVLDFKHDMEGDFALLKLDRPVEGVTPLKLSKLNEAKNDDPVVVLGYPIGLPFTWTGGGRVISHDKNFLRVDNDAWKNNSGSALFNMRTGKVEGILTNSMKGLSFSKIDGCRLSVHQKQDAHVTLVNRLQRIPYLKNQIGEINNLGFENSTSETIHLSIKYRSIIDNDWKTENINLAPGSLSKDFVSMNEEFFVFAESETNQNIIKGRDFYGFLDSPQGREVGYKKYLGQKQKLILKEKK